MSEYSYKEIKWNELNDDECKNKKFDSVEKVLNYLSSKNIESAFIIKFDNYNIYEELRSIIQDCDIPSKICDSVFCFTNGHKNEMSITNENDFNKELLDSLYCMVDKYINLNGIKHYTVIGHYDSTSNDKYWDYYD